VSGSEKPRYQQLKELIIERISSGELQPRDRVPSENELVDATGVSRMTANRALRELNDEGVVERVAGKGTFVAELKADSHLLEVRNIADEIRQRGHRHTARVLLLEARDVTIMKNRFGNAVNTILQHAFTAKGKRGHRQVTIEILPRLNAIGAVVGEHIQPAIPVSGIDSSGVLLIELHQLKIDFHIHCLILP
jgi:DNA-binding transcriptional regulator YhcF (GntR family)